MTCGRLIRCLVVLGCIPATGALAAETYTVPLSVVPGSVTVTSGASVGMPFSVAVSDPACVGGGTFSAEVVDGGLEVEFSGSVSENAEGFPCFFSAATASMQIDVEVPELGGTATMVRLEAIPLQGDFSSISGAVSSFVSDPTGASSSVPGRFETDGLAAGIDWNSSGSSPSNAWATALHAWIPGDTVRIPIRIAANPRALAGVSTTGTFRVRWVIKATVPEPSAALAIPFGALGLAGLASLRSGGG